METEGQTIRKKLAVLLLAEELGNVAEACLRSGISRTQYYARLIGTCRQWRGILEGAQYWRSRFTLNFQSAGVSV